MLTDFITAAMKHATYKLLEDGTYFGEVPELPGTWANADALEACREELQEVVEGWLLVALRRGHPIPTIDGLVLEVTEVAS